MKDSNALQNIRVAFDESEELLRNARLINTTQVSRESSKPISFIKSTFGLWLYSEGLSLAKYHWFKQVLELHQRVYEGYSKLYFNTLKTSETNQQNSISDCYSKLDQLIKTYHSCLTIAKQDFTEAGTNETTQNQDNSSNKAPDVTIVKQYKHSTNHETTQEKISTDNVEKPNLTEFKKPVTNNIESSQQIEPKKQDDNTKAKTENLKISYQSNTEKLFEKLKAQNKKQDNSPKTLPPPKKIQVKAESNDVTNEHLVICRKLEEEDEKQFIIKKEFLAQDLEQVTERQKLFKKAVTQINHHCHLKQQEAKLSISKYKEQLVDNKALQKKKKLYLKDIDNKKETTLKEFKQMEIDSIELEESNAQEQSAGVEKLKSINLRRQSAQKDIKILLKKQDRKRKIIERLKKQVLQVEQELDSLVEEELLQLNEEKSISIKKKQVQNDIEQVHINQQDVRDYNLHLEELKYQDLKQLKKQYYSIQQEILHIEQVHQNLIENNQESKIQKYAELKELQKQQAIKQNLLKVLDLEYKQIRLELEKMTSNQSSPKEELAGLEELQVLAAETIK